MDKNQQIVMWWLIRLHMTNLHRRSRCSQQSIRIKIKGKAQIES